MNRLRVSLLGALQQKSSAQCISLEFRHDVFKYLFNGKGRPAQEKNWQLYEENGFSTCKLSSNWSCLFDKHGDGVKIMFPVKIRKFLCPSPKTYQMVAEAIVEAPRTYTEKLSVKFLKVSASYN